MKLSDIMDVDVEAERVHIANKKWWVDIHTGEPLDRDKREQTMLIVTEISEAMEGARKNLMDDKLPQYKMEHVEIIDAFIRALDYRFGHGIRRRFVSIEYPGPMPSAQFHGKDASYGETLLALVDSAHDIPNGNHRNGMGYPVDQFLDLCYWYACWRGFADQFREIYEAKMAYNATRVDHSIEHRLSEHGKKI